jgi:hypothetical protein
MGFIVVLTACGNSSEEISPLPVKKNEQMVSEKTGGVDAVVAHQQKIRSIINEELAKQYPTQHPDSGETVVDDEAMLEDLVWYWDDDNKKAIFKVDHDNSPRWREARKNIEERLGEMVVIRQAIKNPKMLKDMIEPVTDFLKTKNIKKDMSVSWSPIEEKVIVKVDDLSQELANEIKAKFGSDNITIEEMPDRNAQDT